MRTVPYFRVSLQGVIPPASLHYDDLGRRTDIIRGNGGHANYGYDTEGRLSGLGAIEYVDMIPKPGREPDAAQLAGFGRLGALRL